VIRQKIVAARDLIKCNPLTPELATELFTSNGMGVFRFSAALIEWSESDLNDVKQLCVQAYKNAWHLPQSTASALFIFPKTHAGKESTLPMMVLTQELLLHAERCMRHEDVSQKVLLAGLNRTLYKFLCDSCAELIEEMELWKWDDAPGDFWSRLAKALQQSNISVTWAEHLDSMHANGKMSWAAATRSIRECKMRIERIRGSRLDTDSEVWGLDQPTWEQMWAGKAAMQKSIPALRQAGYESVSDLPRIQKSYREEALVVTPPGMRIYTTSNSEQRVQVLIPVVNGLSQTQRQIMQQYFELMGWQGLKLPSAKRRQ